MLPDGHGTVVVADVVPLVRTGIASVLVPHGFTVVGEASSAVQLREVVERTAPALALIGSVGDLPAADAVRLVRASDGRAAPRVVLLLGRAPRDLLAELLGLDVDGLLPRTVAPAELPLLLARVVGGERVIDPTVLAGDRPDDDAETSSLTAREREVLGLLSSGQSNREIASALYVSLPTVKTHLAHIYAKLGAKNRNEALGRAVALGLLG
jgi:DNA-binding NarL/FixJ family response regulator